MSRLNINNLTNENEDGSPRISGISTFSSTAFLEAPKGTTAQRPENVAPGMIRFNTDSGHLEYYTGEFWDEVLVKETAGISGRGIFAGGNYNPGTLVRANIIDYVTIQSTGDAIDFGDLSIGRDVPAGCASRTRGIIAGGYSGSEESSIDYIEIATLGDAVDFGDLVSNRRNRDGCGDSTRGIMMGGWAPTTAIDVITFASTGSATTGGGLVAARYNNGVLSNSTRGVSGGGAGTAPAGDQVNMEYVTIQSLGTAQNFGDLSTGGYAAGTSSSVRGIFVLNGGTIDYITISTTGNAQDFGDATFTDNNKNATADSTRAVFGGATSPGDVSTLNFITISTRGDASEFGDLTQARGAGAAFSNGHGGL